MAADRPRRSQPIDVSVPEVADAVVKVLQHTKQLDLALAGTTDIVNGWAEFEELGQKKVDKTILQMNQLLLECLLEQNSTGLYNRLTCENILLMVDKNMGGRLSKSQKKHHMCLQWSQIVDLLFTGPQAQTQKWKDL